MLPMYVAQLTSRTQPRSPQRCCGAQITGHIPFQEFKTILRSTMPALARDDNLARQVFGLMQVQSDRVEFDEFVMSALCAAELIP